MTTPETSDQQGFGHITVLLHEAVAALNLAPGALAVDCTLGGGGHTRLLLEAVGKKGKVIAFDRDSTAIENARTAFQSELSSGQLEIVHDAFSNMPDHIQKCGLTGSVNGILADLGVSSPQIDTPERGFSFAKDGPLDMRMDPKIPATAADFVNTMEEPEMMRIFRDFGEEPMAKHFARMICRERTKAPFTTTLQLSGFIEKHSPYGSRSRKHPATKIFQALRIAVNDELGELDRFLAKAIPLLAHHGRLGIITFHSLEDRAVKRFFTEASGKSKRQELGRHVALTEAEIDRMVKAQGKIIPPFPVEPSDRETEANPRARSARLRVFERD
jgi:16S rRNA (cytosine1402-N4)-methyltransferase